MGIVNTLDTNASWSQCELTVTADDPDGALGISAKPIPCESGRYSGTDTTLDGVKYHQGDVETVTFTVTGVNSGPRTRVVIQTESFQAPATSVNGRLTVTGPTP